MFLSHCDFDLISIASHVGDDAFASGIRARDGGWRNRVSDEEDRAWCVLLWCVLKPLTQDAAGTSQGKRRKNGIPVNRRKFAGQTPPVGFRFRADSDDRDRGRQPELIQFRAGKVDVQNR
jgi:hypothetical protein